MILFKYYQNRDSNSFRIGLIKENIKTIRCPLTSKNRIRRTTIKCSHSTIYFLLPDDFFSKRRSLSKEI